MVGRFPDCLARFTDLCVAVGSPLTKNEIVMAAQEHEVWKSEVLSCVEPEIFEMLRAVRARGLKVGLISNALPERGPRLAILSAPRYRGPGRIFLAASA